MPDTANMLRGEFYSTHGTLRCPNFKACPHCTMCESYNRHRHDCQICEARKRPVRVCQCQPKTKLAAVRIAEVLGAPMIHHHHIGRTEKTEVDVSHMAEWEEMRDALGLSPEQVKRPV